MKIDAKIKYTERDKLVIKLAAIKTWLNISRVLLVGFYTLLAILSIYTSAEGIIERGAINVITDSFVFLVFLILLTICTHLLFSKIYSGILAGTVLYMALVIGIIITEYQPQNNNTELFNTLYVFIPILAIFIYTLIISYRYKKTIQLLCDEVYHHDYIQK